MSTEVRMWRCGVCGKHFKSGRAYAAHSRWHSKEEKAAKPPSRVRKLKKKRKRSEVETEPLADGAKRARLASLEQGLKMRWRLLEGLVEAKKVNVKQKKKIKNQIQRVSIVSLLISSLPRNTQRRLTIEDAIRSYTTGR